MRQRILEEFLEMGRRALSAGVPYSQILTSVMELETSDEAVGKEEPWQKSVIPS